MATATREPSIAGAGSLPPPSRRPVARRLATHRRGLGWRRTRALALLVVLVAFVAVGIVGLGGWSAAAGVTPPPTTVVIQPGQTIWDLAGAHTPEGSSRAAYAHAITVANEVDPLRVTPGTELELP